MRWADDSYWRGASQVKERDIWTSYRPWVTVLVIDPQPLACPLACRHPQRDSGEGGERDLGSSP
jgi:hypothetical protein